MSLKHKILNSQTYLNLKITTTNGLHSTWIKPKTFKDFHVYVLVPLSPNFSLIDTYCTFNSLDIPCLFLLKDLQNVVFLCHLSKVLFQCSVLST